MNKERRIEETILQVLKALAGALRESTGEAWMTGNKLQKVTNLTPIEINDAITILEEQGYVELLKGMGSAPFKFFQATLTAKGRLELERRSLEETQKRAHKVEENRREWDLFICHASEDKEEIVRPLVEALIKEGFQVWYDEFTLTLGDSLRRSIDKGLAQSKYGLVVLSPNFFAKNWPQTELDGLAARERDGEKVVLPVWHKVNREYVTNFSPTLADRFAVSTKEGINKVVEEVLRVVKPSKSQDVESIGHIQAHIFFPARTPEEHKTLDYHKKHLHHRLIVNHKTKPPKAYYMTPNSYGWKFIKDYPHKWVSEVVYSDTYSLDDPNFTKKWCDEKGYELIARVAEKRDLLESD